MESKSSLTFTFQGDHEVDAISIVTAMQGLIKISNEIAKQNYPDVEFRLAVRALVPESREVTVTRQNEILYIRKPDLLSKTKWEFKSDKYITADVEDKAFLDSVQSGKQSIVARMYIIADVRLVMEMGPDGLPDENTCKYTVVKVHSVHVPGDGQLGLTE